MPKKKPETQTTGQAKSDKVPGGIRLVPPSFEQAVGNIFAEGLRYGEDNWKAGANDVAWIKERYEHARQHLNHWAQGNESEDHLAKVAWFLSVLIAFRDQPEFTGSAGWHFAMHGNFNGMDVEG